MNDLIGIGCTVDSEKNREVEVGDEMRIFKCFVYKLVNCSAPQVVDDVVVLSDEELDDDPPQNAVENVSNVNELASVSLLEPGDEVLVECVSGGAAEQNGIEAFDIGDQNDDEIDIEQTQWSQRVMLDIKQEAQSFVISDDEEDADGRNKDSYVNGNAMGFADDVPDDAVADPDENDDFDDSTTNWMNRLSQDQDKVQERRNQQKRTKMIDSLPLKRRKSVSVKDDTPKRRKSISTSSSASADVSPWTDRRKSESSRPKMTIKLDGFIKPKRHETDKKDLAECRKAKLSEIAQNQQIARQMENTHSKERVVTKPKVKNSESRGAFLVQVPPVKERKRLKSKSEVDENRKQHQLIGVASTSRGPPKNTDAGDSYIDHLDPFAVEARRKSISEQAKTIADAFAEIDQHYIAAPKKRVARVKSIYAAGVEPNRNDRKAVNGLKLVSILKKSDGAIKGREKRVVFRDEIRSKELVDFFEFTANENENCDILVNVPSNEAPVTVMRTGGFQSNPLHEIISEVTSWNVEWLLKKIKLPPICGANSIITPLLNKYPSFEVFQK